MKKIYTSTNQFICGISLCTSTYNHFIFKATDAGCLKRTGDRFSRRKK